MFIINNVWIYFYHVAQCQLPLTALGIAAENPQRSEDLQRKARPEGNAINLLLFM